MPAAHRWVTRKPVWPSYLSSSLEGPSLLQESAGETANVVVSTICTTHNRYGKTYLFFIVRLHRWGVQWLISQANKSGRL
jgi:hypothetical protein